MPFACIYVPDFPVEAMLRAEPDLRAQAVAVIEGNPPVEKVSTVNEEARRAGVCAGMTKLQAELCNGIKLRNRSELQEAAAHQALLDCAQSFSPRVEDAASDTLLLDVSGLKKLFGPLPKVAREISCRARSMGLETNVAVASTLESACLAAHGFSGVTVIPEGKEAEVLGSLPVEVLFSSQAEVECQPAAEFKEIFERWGVRKFRDLAALPEIALTERLGQTGLDLQRKARGMCARNLLPCDPPLIFEEAVELEYPIVLLDPLAIVLNRMLEQLCSRLQGRALAAQQLHLELTLENGFLREPSHNSSVKNETRKGTFRLRSGQTPAHEGSSNHEGSVAVVPPLPRSLRQDAKSRSQLFQRTIHLPVPLLDRTTFLKLLQLDLKANPPGAPIIKVRLRIQPAKPRPAQNGFFVHSSPEPEKLELTLARITAIVGDDRVGSPALLATHRREAFEMRHFTPTQSWGDGHPARPGGHRSFALRKQPALDHLTDTLTTALRIFRPPVYVRVNFSKSKLSHIRSLKGRRISGDVLWSAGPWRCSGDWWERDAWMRDEWDIAVQEQNGIVMYRLVHDLIDGRWILEGTYD
jgi:protein ImuB